MHRAHFSSGSHGLQNFKVDRYDNNVNPDWKRFRYSDLDTANVLDLPLGWRSRGSLCHIYDTPFYSSVWWFHRVV